MATKQSPRITSAGVLTWYCGDNFDLDYVVSLTKNGSPIVFADGDAFQVSFYKNNDSEKPVYSFICDQIHELVPNEEYNNLTLGEYDVNNEIIHYITLSFTPDITKAFDVGLYNYCIKYIEGATGYSTTIAAKRRAEVQRCH